MINFEKIKLKYYARSTAEQNRPVLDFIKSLKTNKSCEYLEVGAGSGHFAELIKNNYKNINITCLEINPALNTELKTKGLNSLEGSILDMPFNDNSFDIVHCSHVIEHFGYPEIARALDELFRVAKKNGYVIIRSPLMHHGFYNDIDHVRPYPPKTILQYFNHTQQQKTSPHKIKLINEFHRSEPYEINFNLKFITRVNYLLKLLWSKFGWPKGKPSGYTAIFEKL